MLFLIALIVACAFSWFCAKPLKSHPTLFYVTAVVVSVIMVMIAQIRPEGIPQAVNTYVIGLFNRGALAAALWCIVAYIGALPDNAKTLKKELMPVRGELSIFSALVTISHAVTYGVTYIKRLTSGRPVTETVFILTCIICCLLMLIMIPLTVISFKTIRKKIKPQTWKAIQRIAYIFYALIYLHVMVIFIPRARIGREGAMLSVIVYSVVFLGYAVLRIYKAILKNKKPENTSFLNVVCTAVFVLTVGGLCFSSRPVDKVHTADTNTAPVAPATTTTTPQTITPTETSLSANEIIPETTAPSAVTQIQAVTTAPSAVTQTQAVTTAPSAVAQTQAVTTALPAVAQTQAVTPETAPVVAETPPPAETAPPQEEQPADPQPVQNEPAPEPEPQPQPDPQPEQQPEPEPQQPEPVLYNNGTYNSTQMGFDSQVYITVTIDNDVITDLTASCNESDMWYFENAYGTIKNAILSSQSPDVDIVAESTISSNAIMNGVRDCLNQARK